MSTNPAYAVLESDEDRQSTGDELNEVDYLPATVSHKANIIVIGIAFFIAVLALVVALVSIGQSTAFNSNSNSEIQNLSASAFSLILRSHHSVNTIGDLGHRISTLQRDTETLNISQYGE